MVIRRRAVMISAWFSTILRRRQFTRLQNPAGLSPLMDRGLKIFYMLFFLILTSGVVNTILEGSRPELTGQLVVPMQTVQTLAETFINFFILLTGISAIYVAYLSGQRETSSRVANLYLVSGILLLTMAIWFAFSLLALK